jgi:hypothetical protein
VRRNTHRAPATPRALADEVIEYVRQDKLVRSSRWKTLRSACCVTTGDSVAKRTQRLHKVRD